MSTYSCNGFVALIGCDSRRTLNYDSLDDRACFAFSGTVGWVLRFTFGTMAAGKSTLALQLVWQLERVGRNVELWTFGDRSGEGRVSSRLGLAADARCVAPASDLTETTQRLLVSGCKDLVVDEVQFATVEQVDVLERLVDDHGVDVYAFGLASDFTSTLFPASARLLAVADELAELPVPARCWCGATGRLNARVVGGVVQREGPQQLVGDVGDGGVGGDEAVVYEVLCRRHFRDGLARATVARPGETATAGS